METSKSPKEKQFIKPEFIISHKGRKYKKIKESDQRHNTNRLSKPKNCFDEMKYIRPLSLLHALTRHYASSVSDLEYLRTDFTSVIQEQKNLTAANSNVQFFGTSEDITERSLMS